MSDKCIVYFSEDGKQFVKMPNGEKIPAIFNTKVEQDVDEAHVGLARVTISLWCYTNERH